MKRLHVHIKTHSLEASVNFYSALFNASPDKLKSDYARWRLSNPPAIIAVSTSDADVPGVSHIGLSTDSESDLEPLAHALRNAEFEAVPEKNTTCCYARSDKYWSRDPQNIPVEIFYTFDESPSREKEFQPENTN